MVQKSFLGALTGKAERPRHDSDYGIEVSVEFDLPAEDRLVRCESRRPQCMADQNHSRADLFLVGSKAAAQFRADPERREKVLRHHRAVQLYGPVKAIQS